MNVLIVGLGSIARKHLAAMWEIEPDVNVFALRSSERAISYNGIQNVFSISDVRDIHIDFAIVSTPTAEHKKTIETLFMLRCPLFIEKPLYHTLEIAELCDKIEKNGLLTYVACNLRFLECVRFVKEKLQQKSSKINEVNVYCGSYLPDWRPNVDFREVYSALPEAGGGVHIDLIHEIDYLYWFFGKPTFTHRIFRNTSSLKIRAYDYVNYNLEYVDFCASVILNYYRRDAKRTLEIVWEDGTWTVDLLENKIFEDGKLIFFSENSIGDTYTTQMKYFMELVKKGDKDSLNTFHEALDVLKICLK